MLNEFKEDKPKKSFELSDRTKTLLKRIGCLLAFLFVIGMQFYMIHRLEHHHQVSQNPLLPQEDTENKKE